MGVADLLLNIHGIKSLVSKSLGGEGEKRKEMSCASGYVTDLGNTLMVSLRSSKGLILLFKSHFYSFVTIGVTSSTVIFKVKVIQVHGVQSNYTEK